MLDGARTAYGVARSLCIYYGSARRARAMRALYRPLIPSGSLTFDIGSHVGDRVACFRRLGARVVAVEPQPALARTLRLLFGRDGAVTVVEAAVGAREGEARLHENAGNPTVATLSGAFVTAAAGAAGWSDQRWTEGRRVPVTTLDALIAHHGRPAFAKIDVEGLEGEVLAGLSTPLAALSFEFTTIQRAVARDALERCKDLGHYEFNAALGESQRLVHERWQDAATLSRWLDALPDDANSGDVYARLSAAAGPWR